MMSTLDELFGETNAEKWAKEFVKVAELRPDIPSDEGTMVGWFASAIMAGYDEGRRAERLGGFEERIREIAYMAAGAGSGAVMEEAPDVVMPSQELSKRVEGILMEFGIQPEERSQLRDSDNAYDDSPQTERRARRHSDQAKVFDKSSMRMR